MIDVEVEPTRIGALGVGTFLILSGGILYTIGCFAISVQCTNMNRPGRLYFIITFLYMTLVLFLTNAKRRSRWAVPDNVVSDVDNLWLTHILVGTVAIVNCVVGLLAWIWWDFLSVVVAKEIDTESDRKRRNYGQDRFMF